MHCVHPFWLEHSIFKSLHKLKLETIDCVYLQDPLENILKLTQGDPVEMRNKLQQAFQFLEELVQDGKIGAYGITSSRLLTLDIINYGLTAQAEIKKIPQFSLQQIANLAGPNFKFLQTPFNY